MNWLKNDTISRLELAGLQGMINTPSSDQRGEDAMFRMIMRNAQGSSNAGVHFHTPITTEEGTQVFIAEKSNGIPVMTFMIYAHTDTETGDAGGYRQTGDLHDTTSGQGLFRTKPERQSTASHEDPWIHGRGSIDMKHAIQQMIHLMHTVQVPDGLRVIFVCAPGEERNSSGAFALLNTEEGRQLLQNVDLILSSEIGPHDPNFDIVRMIIGRRGSYKGVLELNGMNAKGGHASYGGPDLSVLQSQIIACLHGAGSVLESRLVTSRVLLQSAAGLNEREDIRWSAGTQSQPTVGVTAPSLLKTPFEAHVTDGDTCAAIKNRLVQVLAALDDILNWQAQKIDVRIVDDKTRISYEPYAFDGNSGLFLPMHQAAEQVTPGKKLVISGGPSQADQNLFAAAGYLCADFPPIGKGAHGPDEALYLQSYIDIRELLRYLIEEAFKPEIAARRGKSSIRRGEAYATATSV